MKVELMKNDTENCDESSPSHGVQSKLNGVKKISNKEHRRRQQKALRRLITPKNELMVLNELLPNEIITYDRFKVEEIINTTSDITMHIPSFCAEFDHMGRCYRGYGNNMEQARVAAAEQIVKEILLKQMSAVHNPTDGQDGVPAEDESLPMIQLASYAIHKLFAEWRVDERVVEMLRTHPNGVEQVSEALESDVVVAAEEKRRARVPSKPKQLPESAELMHPCIVLSYMRPQTVFRPLAVSGDRPQSMRYTVGVDVDGSTYMGTAASKKDARREAARAACQALFGVSFTY